MLRRIVITGSTGSGKTTLAGKISAARGNAVVDLDELHWLPNWSPREPEAFRALVATAAAGDNWVMSGNYKAVRDLMWERADTVVWLDYSFPRTFWQLSRRSFLRVRDKIPVCNGNVETLGKIFSRDSIILWLLTSYRRRRAHMLGILDNPGQYPHITFIRLKNPKETEQWLNSISSRP